MRRFLFCLWVWAILCEGRRNATAVEEVISLREQLVVEIARKAEDLYLNRTERVASCTCSLHDCAHTFGPPDDMQCTSELLFDTCEEDCGERLVNYRRSGITTPFGTNPEALSTNLKQNICTYSGLETEFVKIRADYGLANSWTYAGFQDGHFRTWPLRARGADPENADPYLRDCQAYDPRRRPWYSAASTGPKDVVLLVDRSVSTIASAGTTGEQSSLWERAQQAVLSLLDTFIHADSVNVVLFSSQAEALWTEAAFAEATPDNITKLSHRVRQARPSGSTNLEAGFNTSIDLFIKGRIEGSSTRCNQIIILLTEGADTRRKTSEVLASIEELQDRLENKTGSRAHIFTYSLGPDADESMAQQIACANQGIWSPVRRLQDPLSDMINYLEAVSVVRAHEGPVWVYPYEDAGGLGLVSTVSMPIFSRDSPQDPPLLLGVVGHDVILQDLIVGGYDAKSVLDELVERSKTCTKLELQACDLQVRRYMIQPNKQCVDVYPERTCYQYGQRWYRRFDSIRSQFYAKAFCQSRSGTLSPIRSSEHLRFLAAIASADKSWLGGERELGVDPIRYSFIDTDVPPIDHYHEGWAAHQLGDARQSCMTIDRRSTLANLESAFCEEEYDFICEFPSAEAAGCDGSSLEVTATNGHLKTFAVPFPEECPEIERVHRAAEPVHEAQGLASKDVICEFGPPVYREELYCCRECLANETLEISHSVHSSPPFLTFFVILYSLLWAVL